MTTTSSTTEAPPATTEKVPFGTEHIRAVCKTVVLPIGVDKAELHWGWRLNSVDLASSHGYVWPPPGNWTVASGPVLAHKGDCCKAVGDGICAALTITGAQSADARFSHHVALLVAWTDDDQLGRSADKVRLRRCWVAGLADPVAAAVAAATGADLRGANLWGADLRGANLWGANLRDANLRDADLGDAKYNDTTTWPGGFMVLAEAEKVAP